MFSTTCFQSPYYRSIHELAAGKLHALLGREASRDLFDSHRLLTEWILDKEQLRLAFTVYAGMEQDHWQRIHRLPYIKYNFFIFFY